MSAIFNGTSSDLSATVSSVAIEYPVFVSCWVKPLAATANYTLVAASDDGAGGSLDGLVVSARGDQTNDPVWATSTAAGSSSSAAKTSFSGQIVNPDSSITWHWQHVAALFLSESHRRVRVSQGSVSTADWGTEETTSRAVGNVTKWSIGTLHNSGATDRFAGRLCEVGVWQGISEDRAYFAADLLRNGLTPLDIWFARDDLFLSQRLISSANTTLDIGPTMTASNLTFTSDHAPRLQGPYIGNLEEPPPFADPDRPALPWPDFADEIGPLPGRRIVTLSAEGRIELAADDSTNWIGATHTSGSRCWGRQFVTLRSGGRRLKLEPAAGASFTVGTSEAYLAADGTIDDEGTVAIGIVSGQTTNYVEIIPY